MFNGLYCAVQPCSGRLVIRMRYLPCALVEIRSKADRLLHCAAVNQMYDPVYGRSLPKGFHAVVPTFTSKRIVCEAVGKRHS